MQLYTSKLYSLENIETETVTEVLMDLHGCSGMSEEIHSYFGTKSVANCMEELSHLM